MRLVSLSAAAALTISLIFAPQTAGADDITHRGNERRVRQVHAARRWGADNVILGTRRSGPRDRILPHAVVEYNTATDKICTIDSIDFNRGIPVAGASSLREARENYLKANHVLLALSADLSEMRLERERPSGKDVRFGYAQFYRGLPVFGGAVHAIARKDAVLRVSANLVPVTVDRQLAVSSDSAPAISAVISDVARHYPAASNDRIKPRAWLAGFSFATALRSPHGKSNT